MNKTFSQSNPATNNLGFVAISNLASGGAIGTAAATVDVYPGAEVTQTTASQTLTLPTPTGSTPRSFYVFNTGSVSFTLYQKVIFPGTGIQFFYSAATIANMGRTWMPGGGVSATVTTTTSV